MAPLRTIGTPSREREIAAPLVLLGGALALAVLAAVQTPFYRSLLVLGAVVVAAWLVDGTSRRYMAPGLMALAAGIGSRSGRTSASRPSSTRSSTAGSAWPSC